MSIIRRNCKHQWIIAIKSNVLQQDKIGYPLRLVCVECKKCGKSDHWWMDVDEEELKELETGKSVLLKWDH